MKDGLSMVRGLVLGFEVLEVVKFININLFLKVVVFLRCSSYCEFLREGG